MIEDNLLPLVLITAVVGVVLPRAGTGLVGVVTPLLALLMLCVSLTFDLATLRQVLARPGVQALATVLVYGPMSLVAFALGMTVFGPVPLGLGIVLVGTLPTDVSSPLLVWIARGDVALATVLNAVNTALAPVVVPGLFLLYTGIRLEVGAAALVIELAITVLTPTLLGVGLRTWRPGPITRLEPALSATASLAYLALLLAVVGPNAAFIRSQPTTVLGVAAIALLLNVAGYVIAAAASPLLPAWGDKVALAFTVSKKEFSIAAVVVAASGLPTQVALPAAVYAVVQMVTSPLVAGAMARRQPVGAHDPPTR